VPVAEEGHQLESKESEDNQPFQGDIGPAEEVEPERGSVGWVKQVETDSESHQDPSVSDFIKKFGERHGCSVVPVDRDALKYLLKIVDQHHPVAHNLRKRVALLKLAF
jgi:hypothetical protein